MSQLGEYNKNKFTKWRLAVLYKLRTKEINEIKINSILKNMKDPTKFGVKLFQGIYFILFYKNVNNILGLQIISRKNITLVYKDGQFIFLIFT